MSNTAPGIIIVTGSNGRIGEAVMRRLAGRHGDVVGFDRKAPTPPPPHCVYVPVDITSDQSVRDGLRTIHDHHGAHVVSVVHLAAYYDFFGKPSTKYEDITVNGTRRILRGLHEFDFDVEQFIFSSTMLVHRPGEPGQFISEDSPVDPTWAYPRVQGSHRADHPHATGAVELTCRHPSAFRPASTNIRLTNPRSGDHPSWTRPVPDVQGP